MIRFVFNTVAVVVEAFVHVAAVVSGTESVSLWMLVISLAGIVMAGATIMPQVRDALSIDVPAPLD